MEMTQQEYDRLRKPQSGDPRDVAEPHGLARLDVQAINDLRRILLTVIDDGNPKHLPIAGVRKKEWYLWSYQESAADQERLDFVSTIIAEITKQAKG